MMDRDDPKWMELFKEWYNSPPGTPPPEPEDED